MTVSCFLAFFEAHGETILGMVVGAVVTWVCSRFYYKQAAEDLRREAVELRAATDRVLYYLDNPEANKKLLRDNEGRSAGVAVSASVAFGGSGGFGTPGKAE